MRWKKKPKPLKKTDVSKKSPRIYPGAFSISWASSFFSTEKSSRIPCVTDMADIHFASERNRPDGKRISPDSTRMWFPSFGSNVSVLFLQSFFDTLKGLQAITQAGNLFLPFLASLHKQHYTFHMGSLREKIHRADRMQAESTGKSCNVSGKCRRIARNINQPCR